MSHTTRHLYRVTELPEFLQHKQFCQKSIHFPAQDRIVSVSTVSMGHSMDVEKSIADLAFLEELYALPDERPIRTSGGEAASPKHNELYGRILWVTRGLSLRNQLQPYGMCGAANDDDPRSAEPKGTATASEIAIKDGRGKDAYQR